MTEIQRRVEDEKDLQAVAEELMRTCLDPEGKVGNLECLQSFPLSEPRSSRLTHIFTKVLVALEIINTPGVLTFHEWRCLVLHYGQKAMSYSEVGRELHISDDKAQRCGQRALQKVMGRVSKVMHEPEP